MCVFLLINSFFQLVTRVTHDLIGFFCESLWDFFYGKCFCSKIKVEEKISLMNSAVGTAFCTISYI